MTYETLPTTVPWNRIFRDFAHEPRAERDMLTPNAKGQTVRSEKINSHNFTDIDWDEGYFKFCEFEGLSIEGRLAIMRPDHGGAVQGDRSDAKENWGQARLSQERAAPARS